MSADGLNRCNSPDHAVRTGGRRAVFRHRGMVTVFVVGSVILLLFNALAWSQAIAGNIVGTLVLSVGMWFIWASGWWTKVVVSEHGVCIDNIFFRHIIPWKVFVEFSLDMGLVARLSDESTVGAISFGGSFAGALTQYRGLSKKRDAIMAACDRCRSTGGSASGQYRRLIRPHWVALLAYVFPLVGVAIAIDASRHVL